MFSTCSCEDLKIPDILAFQDHKVLIPVDCHIISNDEDLSIFEAVAEFAEFCFLQGIRAPN